jgi:hypothetical protein
MTSRSWPNGDAEERDDVAALFGVERGRLLELLGELLPGDWHRPSPCPGWSVFDLCGHLVGDDLGWLARQRDDHHGTVPPEAVDQVEGGIARWLDDLQDQWVHSARRLGPAWSQTFWPGPARRSSTRWSARTRPASMGRSRGHAPGPYRCGWTSSVKSPSSGSTASSSSKHSAGLTSRWESLAGISADREGQLSAGPAVNEAVLHLAESGLAGRC